MEDKVYALVKLKDRINLELIADIFRTKGFDAGIIENKIHIGSNPSLFEGYFSTPIECRRMRNSNSGVEAKCYYLKKGQRINLPKEIKSYVKRIKICCKGLLVLD